MPLNLRLMVMLLLLLPGIGCQAHSPGASADAPLASLRGASGSVRFGVAYWAEQAHLRTSAWRQAVAFCSGRLDARYPNCSTVHLVARWENPPDLPPLPAFRLPSELGREVEGMSPPKGERR